MINIFWPYENKNGITDQIFSLTDFFKRNGIKWQISKYLCTNCKNLAIENFDQLNSNYLINFCEIHKIKVTVLVTEFLRKNNNNQYLINDILEPINIQKSNNKNNLLNRVFYLKKIAPYIDSFISILNIPSLTEYHDFFGINNLYSIDIGFSSKNSSEIVPLYDFYFSGALTDYRKDIIYDLSRKYSVLTEKKFVSDHDRIINIAKCRYSLNIPQSESWKGDSLMRVLFSLRNNKLVISLNKNKIDMDELSKYIIEYDNFLIKNYYKSEILIPNNIKTNLFPEDEAALLFSIRNSYY